MMRPDAEVRRQGSTAPILTVQGAKFDPELPLGRIVRTAAMERRKVLRHHARSSGLTTPRPPRFKTWV